MYKISEFANTAAAVDYFVGEFEASAERFLMINAKMYYNGENTTIAQVAKEIVVKEETGRLVKKKNPFVANHKISYAYLSDMVDQKVFTLLDKMPVIDGVSEKTLASLRRADYSLQKLAVEASLCGYAFAFVEASPKLTYKVFDTENCIPFLNDYTDELDALIRFYVVYEQTTGETISYAEVYEKDVFTLYAKTDNEYEVQKQCGFRYEILGNAINVETVEKSWENGLPVIMLINNDKYRPDFTRAIREKIDAIDIVQSDFCNNLADFQQIYTVVKGMDEVDAKELGSFMETLQNTNGVKLPEGSEIEFKEITIPYEAKVAFVDLIKKQLINDGGTVDYASLVGGSLTNVAIKASMQRLMLRVSKFEYQVYLALEKMVQFAKEVTGDTATDFEIEFGKMYIDNDTETISNLNASQPYISQETYLRKHPYVDNPKREAELIEEENKGKFELKPLEVE